MLVTLDLPTELERQLQTQADREQLSLNELVEKILTQTLPLESAAELTLEAIEEMHPDTWVAVEETAWDDQDEPISGIVVAHSSNRDDLSDAIHRFRQKKPQAILYVFYTGQLIPEGVMVMV